jgi:hypothetical protein
MFRGVSMLKLAVKNPKFYFFAKSVPFFWDFELKFSSLPDLETEDFCRYSLSRQGPGGQFVTTAEKRFVDLDGIAVPLIAAQKDPVIHDIAVSSGITSLELFEALVDRGIRFVMNISDKNLECFYTGDLIRRVYDSDEKFFEGYFFGILGNRSLSNKYFVSKYLGRLLDRPPGSAKRVKIQYLDRRIRPLVDAGQIHCIRCDILRTDLSDRFTFVRCMNLLNLKYFVDDDIRRAMRLILRSMREDAIFQVGRTVDNVNHASFFRKSGEKLALIQDVHDGAEIKEVIGDFVEK